MSKSRIVMRPLGRPLATSVVALGLAAFGMPVGAILMPNVAFACTANALTGEVACLEDDADGIELNTNVDVNALVQAVPAADITISDGIRIIQNGDEAVDMEVNGTASPGTVTITTDGSMRAHAIEIAAGASFQPVNVTTTTNTFITTTGTGRTGIFIDHSGNVSVDSSSIINVVETGIDLYANSSDATATVDVRATITAGATNAGPSGDNGVLVNTVDGAAIVRLHEGGDIIEAGGSGVEVITASGAVTIEADSDIGTIANPLNGSGIVVATNSGAVGITVRTIDSTTGSVTTTGNAISVTTLAGALEGIVTVTSSGALASTGGNGIFISGNDAAVNVTTRDGGTINVNNVSNDAADDGMDISTDAGAVTVNVGDTIDAAGNGINITTGTGVVNVTTAAPDPYQGDPTFDDPATGLEGGAIDVDGIGINVASSGGSTVNITTNATLNAGQDGIVAALTGGTGNLTIENNASVDSVLDGIDASISGGSGNILVNMDAALTSTTDDGIQTFHSGSGTTTVNVNSALTAGNSTNYSDAGIQANVTGTGALTITTAVGSSITGTGLGIEARTNTGAGVTATDININGSVDTNFRELYVNTNAAGAAIDVAGSINVGDGTNQVGRADDLVAEVLGGATTLTNNGTIWGRIETSGGNFTFNNNSPNTWATVGISVFGGAADVVNNTFTDPLTYGRIETAVVGGTGETTQFDELETLINAGVIDLGDDTGSFARDRLYTSGDYQGQGGLLVVDATFAAGVQDSDRFLVGGDTSGITFIEIHDQTGGVGALTTSLIPVVTIVGASNGTFELEDGPIDVGLFSYDLTEVAAAGAGIENGLVDDPFTPNTIWALEGYEDASVFNLASLPGIANTTWATTTEGWLTRAGDLRNYYLAGDSMSADVPDDMFGNSGFGIWTRIIGSQGERFGTEELGPNDVEYDTGYGEMLVAGQLGADFTIELDGSAVVLGAFGGYVSNQIGFNDGDSASLSGPQAGVYIDWVSGGGTYISALGKVDLLTLSYDLGGLDDDSTEATTYGGVLEAGHRITIGDFFIEPVASIAYSVNGIGEMTFGEDDVNFLGASLNGKIGGRIGGTFGEEWVIAPYAEGYVGQEFLGVSAVDVESTGETDVDFSGLYTQFGGGVNIDNAFGSGLTGFVEGDVRMSTNAASGTVRGGLSGQF